MHSMFNSLGYMQWICSSQAKQLEYNVDCPYAFELIYLILNTNRDPLDLSMLCNDDVVKAVNDFVQNNKSLGTTND